MADATQSRGPIKQSAWAPLRIKAFRALWLAQVGSMIGTWMQTVGAQWLLVEEPGADTLVAMVQVAAMLPMLVLALPSGALADTLDRRRMLIGVQLFQACVAVALAALTVAHALNANTGGYGPAIGLGAAALLCLCIGFWTGGAATSFRKIAETKFNDLNARDIDHACRIIAGTARSMGVDVKA